MVDMLATGELQGMQLAHTTAPELEEGETSKLLLRQLAKKKTMKSLSCENRSVKHMQPHSKCRVRTTTIHLQLALQRLQPAELLAALRAEKNKKKQLHIQPVNVHFLHFLCHSVCSAVAQRSRQWHAHAKRGEIWTVTMVPWKTRWARGRGSWLELQSRHWHGG